MISVELADFVFVPFLEPLKTMICDARRANALLCGQWLTTVRHFGSAGM
jgi:hypothetical protein